MEKLRISVETEEKSAATPVRREILHLVEEAQVQASANLLTDLRRMVNNPTFSDVTFVCQDGKRVQASRTLLAGRSDLLKSMLMSGMAESSLSEIKLPEISSPVLLSVVEFLYTGTLLDYCPGTWSMACEVINASQFFLLPKLDIIARKVMLELTTAVAEDLPRAASLLTDAVEYKTLCDETDVSLKELVTILSSDWSESLHLRSLSEEAFHYLLRSTNKGKGEDDGEISFEEYLRFRQVIRWWICRSDQGSRGTEELLDVIAPDKEKALSICRNLEDIQRVGSTLRSRASYLLSLCRQDEPARKAATGLLSNIDFRRIHPILLATVAEPLEIVSSTDILSAFRFHAQRRPKNFQRSACSWEHGDSHRTLERGYVIRKARSTIGKAVMMTAMSTSYAIYEWHFIVEEIPHSFCELGFTGVFVDVEGERLSHRDDAKVLDFLVAGARINLGGAEGHGKWKILGSSLERGSKAIFSFDAYDGTCSLILDGQDYGVVWEDIPRGTYYPAVSLGESFSGAVRIELVKGFD